MSPFATDLVPFNRPPFGRRELEYLREVYEACSFSGNGGYTRRCHDRLKQQLGVADALLTQSCTAALEMAAILAQLEPGDEVLMPSFTFVSTANAVVLRQRGTCLSSTSDLTRSTSTRR